MVLLAFGTASYNCSLRVVTFNEALFSLDDTEPKICESVLIAESLFSARLNLKKNNFFHIRLHFFCDTSQSRVRCVKNLVRNNYGIDSCILQVSQ
jgi:hypothetical protein